MIKWNMVGNGIWSKGVIYNLITIINEMGVEKYYNIITHEKIKLIKTAHGEIEMVKILIETNVHKYENIIDGAGEMNIYALDQACADIDIAIEYIRKITQYNRKKRKIDIKKEYEKNRRISLKKDQKGIELIRLIYR